MMTFLLHLLKVSDTDATTAGLVFFECAQTNSKSNIFAWQQPKKLKLPLEICQLQQQKFIILLKTQSF